MQKMKTKLDRVSPVPLYYQVQQKIKEFIIERDCKQNEKFIPERELSTIFEVDRGTIRRAMDMLLKEGIIYKVHRDKGRGTFIRRLPKEDNKPALLKIGYFVYGVDPCTLCYSRLLRGIQVRAESKGYVFAFGSSDKKKVAMLNWIRDKQINGLIITGDIRDPLINEIERANIPFITVGNYALKKKVNSINLDARSAVKQALSHVIERGCRGIGLIAGKKSWCISRELEAGIRDELAMIGEEPASEHLRFSDDEDGYKEIKHLMESSNVPEAVVVTDPAFWGVARYIFEKRYSNMKLPLLVKYGGDAVTSRYSELISVSISFDDERLGQTAVDHLLKMIVSHDQQILQEKHTLNVQILEKELVAK